MEDGEDLSSGLLLRDIEEISKALYLPKNPPNSSNSYSDSKSKESMNKHKKSSMWNWKKPLKAFTHTNNHRYNCRFFLHVHDIEGLPSNFNNLNLCVTWKRKKGDVLKTCPASVSKGMVEFEETLVHRCTIYASSGSGAYNIVTYEPKFFLLHTFVVEAPAADIGKHWIDLTRLLPLTLEELEGEKRSSGKWTTSFKLTGKAEGAILNVSFGFSVLDSSLKVREGGLLRVNHYTDLDSQLENLGSVSTASTQSPNHESRSSIDINSLDKISPNRESELRESITLLYRKLDEEKLDNVKEFDFYYEQLESLSLQSDPLIESVDGNSGDEDNDVEFIVIEQGVEICTRDEVNIEHQGRQSQRFDGSPTETVDVVEIFKEEDNVEGNPELNTSVYVDYESEKDDPEPTLEELGSVLYDILQSRSMDLDSLLGTDKCDKLENCNEATSSYIASNLTKSLNLDSSTESIENDFLNMLSIEEDVLEFANDIDLTFGAQTNEASLISLTPSMRTRKNAKLLENLETEYLMHEWGLDENAFQNSPHASSSGFGSPVYIPKEEPLKLPSLVEGFGPIINTKDGGLLRSLSPLLFRNAKNGARLIVQVSAPVVLPPAMGLTSMEILQCWASEGVEKISPQVKELMPLEDITEKTIKERVAAEANSRSDAPQSYSWALEDMESEYVSFETLVPLAIKNIEGLLLEGLKIQSGLQDQEAPSSITIQFSGDFEELVKCSVSLEKWVKLYSDDSDAKSIAFGKNFVMALRVQLRDPLRNYETVGSTMLALIQVDVSVYSSERFDLNEKQKIAYEEKSVPIFKVLEVHLAGLNVLVDNNNNNNIQKRSGSRWLLSSGVAKANNKHPISSSNQIIKPSSRRMGKACQRDVLWSISSHTQGETNTWDEVVALNVHVRNPDIIFPQK